MSADFTKVLVKDDRLDVVDNIKYAVIKGGQNMTCAQYSAISESNSQLTFNIQVPSEQTIIDRRVLLETQLCLTVNSSVADISSNGTLIDISASPVGCGYGSASALAPFPIHQLMTVATATINNNTVSINIRDVLPAVMRLLDKREVGCYNGTTPTYQDTYASYRDALFNLNNSNAGYYNSNDSDIYPRGSVELAGYDATQVGATTTETFLFKITEPLLLSPFIYANPQSNAQGFYGIQNLNFVLNLGDTSRVFRGLSVPTLNDVPSNVSPSPAGAGQAQPYITSVTPGGTLNGQQYKVLNQSRLLFQFLTPHPSDLMPARNIVPFYELPRYITTLASASTSTVVSTTTSPLANNTYINSVGTSSLLSSQSLQLNQIPDKLIVMIRKTMGTQSNADPEAVMSIRQIVINFNNMSGILSSATKQDLYRMSKDNGSNQNWLEFNGSATIANGNAPGAYNAFKVVPTVGSFLVLEFGKDIQLVEDFYAPGSLGNFNLQVQVVFENYRQYASDLELVLITMNSGVFVNERGTSSTYTGILTKADVLEASEQVAYTRSDVKRLIGGGFLDMIKSSVQKLAPVAKALAPIAKDVASALAPHAKNYLSQRGDTLGNLGAQALGAMGYGASGGRTRLAGRVMGHGSGNA